MRKISFVFAYKFLSSDSLNEVYSGKHWRYRREYAAGVHMFVKNALNKAKASTFEMFNKKVKITLTFPLDGVDIDNHAYFGKCVVDALKGVLIKDDSPKYVRGFSLLFDEREDVLVEVEELAS